MICLASYASITAAEDSLSVSLGSAIQMKQDNTLNQSAIESDSE